MDFRGGGRSEDGDGREVRAGADGIESHLQITNDVWCGYMGID